VTLGDADNTERHAGELAVPQQRVQCLSTATAAYGIRGRSSVSQSGAMTEVVVGSIIGLAGALLGAVVTHLLQRSHSRQVLDLERAKVFSEQRLKAYVDFRLLAERARRQDGSGADRSVEANELRGQLREAKIVIDSIGDSRVVLAAGSLIAAFEDVEPGSIRTRQQAQRVMHAVRDYVNAVRSSFEVEPVRWDATD
jgi:hypothetical protein